MTQVIFNGLPVEVSSITISFQAEPVTLEAVPDMGGIPTDLRPEDIDLGSWVRGRFRKVEEKVNWAQEGF